MSRKVFEAFTRLDASDVNTFLMAPSGVISQYAGSTAPTGYLLCDGASVSTTTYADLFAVIAYTYGGSGANFNLPNLKGNIPVGRDATQTEFDTLGETGGAKTHTLTEAQMPSHTHIQNSHNHTQNAHNHSQNAHSHTVGGNGNLFLVNGSGNSGTANLAVGGGSYSQSTPQTTTATNNAETATNNATTATNQNTGGGQAHNNLQPYIVVNYIIKT
jgi:microcystin-dependent protein